MQTCAHLPLCSPVVSHGVTDRRHVFLRSQTTLLTAYTDGAYRAVGNFHTQCFHDGYIVRRMRLSPEPLTMRRRFDRLRIYTILLNSRACLRCAVEYRPTVVIYCYDYIIFIRSTAPTTEGGYITGLGFTLQEGRTINRRRS